MLFNSPVFFIFFVVVFASYWTLRRYRVAQNALLLAASYLFYGKWSLFFLGLLIASTIVDFACGLAIDATAERRKKRVVLLASLALNLGFLGTFKYAGFFIAQFADLLAWLGFEANRRVLDIVLPVGISFYTFQSMGYVIDVYRGKQRAACNPLEYALYVSFFPQLMAGPIERAGHMLPQYQRPRLWNTASFESGLQLMAWGLFKKVVIADSLAPYVNDVYDRPSVYSSVALVTATVFFAFQIYCDFSGYTDMARGAARTLGFELMKNFNHPYFSRSPVEFWRRWHISLSQWFQDYLYYPLAMHYMRKGGWGSKYKAHIIAMVLIGFWHGANWTFIVFGFYWGCVIALYLYSAEKRMARARSARPKRLRVQTSEVLSVASMFIVVCVGWVFFRSTSLTEAWRVLSGMFVSHGEASALSPDLPAAALLWTLVAGLWIAELAAQRRPGIVKLISDTPLRYAVRYALLASSLFAYIGVQHAVQHPFIYFQF